MSAASASADSLLSPFSALMALRMPVTEMEGSGRQAGARKTNKAGVRGPAPC